MYLTIAIEHSIKLEIMTFPRYCVSRVCLRLSRLAVSQFPSALRGAVLPNLTSETRDYINCNEICALPSDMSGTMDSWRSALYPTTSFIMDKNLCTVYYYYVVSHRDVLWESLSVSYLCHLPLQNNTGFNLRLCRTPSRDFVWYNLTCAADFNRDVCKTYAASTGGLSGVFICFYAIARAR